MKPREAGKNKRQVQGLVEAGPRLGAVHRLCDGEAATLFQAAVESRGRVIFAHKFSVARHFSLVSRVLDGVDPALRPPQILQGPSSPSLPFQPCQSLGVLACSPLAHCRRLLLPGAHPTQGSPLLVTPECLSSTIFICKKRRESMKWNGHQGAQKAQRGRRVRIQSFRVCISPL